MAGNPRPHAVFQRPADSDDLPTTNLSSAVELQPKFRYSSQSWNVSSPPEILDLRVPLSPTSAIPLREANPNPFPKTENREHTEIFAFHKPHFTTASGSLAAVSREGSIGGGGPPDYDLAHALDATPLSDRRSEGRRYEAVYRKRNSGSECELSDALLKRGIILPKTKRSNLNIAAQLLLSDDQEKQDLRSEIGNLQQELTRSKDQILSMQVSAEELAQRLSVVTLERDQLAQRCAQLETNYPFCEGSVPQFYGHMYPETLDLCWTLSQNTPTFEDD